MQFSSDPDLKAHVNSVLLGTSIRSLQRINDHAIMIATMSIPASYLGPVGGWASESATHIISVGDTHCELRY